MLAKEDAMKLSAEQVKAYECDGFLVLPNLLDSAEVALLKSELARASRVEDERIIREKVGAPRIIYGLHEVDGPTGSAAYDALIRSSRVLEPARQLLDDEVYAYHTKCNFKEAIDGAIWQWHQDYANWKAWDAAPRADGMLTAMVMLDKATEMSGCLYFVRGSHRLGLLQPDYDNATTSFGIWSVPKQKMIEMMDELGEPVPIVGEPGTVVLFHANMVHGSGHNMSPRARGQAYLVYNGMSNLLGQVDKPRPDYKANRRAVPLQTSEAARITDVVARQAA
jgi:ectoine hydroxylase